jgi:hypothetical protein
MTRAEQETVIRWDRESTEVCVWSSDPKTWRRMARWGIKPTRETTYGGEPSWKFYRAPLAWLRWSVREPRKSTNPGNAAALLKARVAKTAPPPEA